MEDSVFSRCAISVIRRSYFALVLVIAVLRPTAVFSEDKPAKQPDKQAASSPPVIVCLHTEYLPWKAHEDDTLTYRLMRELGRQAVLVAARDELGLATRDETLGEPFPDPVTQARKDLRVKVRSYYDGNVAILLWAASSPDEKPPRAEQKSLNPRAIVVLTEKLEQMARGELRDKLRGFGFEGKVLPPNEKNLPPDSVEGQLLEMNFVSQFAAVRAAHAAIAEKGQSAVWLGVLARGYAHLALMTEHHWKCDTEVFVARALLYAERLATANKDDSLAHAQRAYVWAIVGLHGAALDELKRVEELRKQHADQPTLPNWFELIEPYCSFEREPVTAIGERRPSLRQLAQRLSFEQYRAFGDDRWLFESAKQTMSVCPEEYGVYAALAGSSGALLSVVRTGADYAPAALAHFLPARVADLAGVPTAVQDAANGVTDKHDDETKGGEEKPKADADQPPAAAESVGQYAAATIPIVQALRATTQSGDDKGEPSWSALGELIFEEQFVQAANYLNVAMNATESSHEDEVKSMLAAVKGHRYARYIESYGVNQYNETDRFNKIIGDMQIVDPRGNMRPMMSRVWRMDNGKGRNSRGSDASWYAFFDIGLTMPEMREAYSSYASTWWSSIDKGMRQTWSNSFRAVSPHAPHTLRLAIALTEKPTYEQAAQWEAEAGEDPAVYVTLGSLFAKLEHYDDAIRAYERSIKLSPTQNAYVGLANTYRAAGQEALWQPTLERFFDVESLGLEHASVHSIIANDLIDKGKWEEAEPHAVAAAETWSAWGLLLASRVDEGLGRWDESEKWVREASNSYPSSSGDEWYFWCRRTGRGNLDDARKLAQAYFTADSIKKSVDGQLTLFTFHMAENDAHAALDDAKNYVKMAEQNHEPDDEIVYERLHLALIARELKETDVAQAAIKETRQSSEKFREKDPDFYEINIAVCDVLDGKTIADNAAAKLDGQLDKGVNKESRCNYEYFLGRAYDLAGNKELADKYWKRCVTRGPFDRYNATLAGKYLADRNKTSRP